jgi:hypothetical protein
MILIWWSGVHAGERLLLISHVLTAAHDVDQIFVEILVNTFFFSNRLLSFTLAVPRIRLRFQTLLSGSPALLATLRAGPGDYS